MANPVPTTPPAANEVPCASVFALEFAAFLPVLAGFIDAERDLEEVQGAFDPAYKAWERDADLAQQRLTTALCALRDLPARAPEDRPLQRMMLLIDGLFGAEDNTTFRSLHRRMHMAFFSQLQVRGYGPEAQRTNTLLLHARHMVDAMATLPLFERWSDADLDSGCPHPGTASNRSTDDHPQDHGPYPQP